MGDVGSDYADERARRREERRRRRAQEKEQEEQEKSSIAETSITTSSSFRSQRDTGPAIEVKLEISTQSSGEDNSKKTPQKSTGKEQFEDKSDINEAELKAEEIRLKREREKEERYKEQLEERRLTREQNEQKQLELEERRERRRLKQLEEEERLKNEQEEREARQAKEAKKLREEIQKRRQEAEERRCNTQNSLGYIKPNYNILDSILQAEREKEMSPEERAAQKARTLEERVPPLDISPSTSEENLQDLALDLQAKLVKLYGATFDLMKRKQRQDYDLNELKSRITDMSEVSSPKKLIIVGTGQGHVSKIKEKGFFVEDKPVKKSFLQERNESIATSGGVQGRLGMFQRKVNQGGDQPDIRRSGRSAWKAPEYDKCCVCVKNVYTLERLEVSKKLYHQQCFRCQYCKKVTSLSDYAMFEGKVYCKTHQRKLARESLQHGQSPHN